MKMKIDRSQGSAMEVVKLKSIEKTNDSGHQRLAVDLLKIGFENQFQKNDTSKIKNLINDTLDQFIKNNK